MGKRCYGVGATLVLHWFCSVRLCECGALLYVCCGHVVLTLYWSAEWPMLATYWPESSPQNPMGDPYKPHSPPCRPKPGPYILLTREPHVHRSISSDACADAPNGASTDPVGQWELAFAPRFVVSHLDWFTYSDWEWQWYSIGMGLALGSC